MMKKQKNKLER